MSGRSGSLMCVGGSAMERRAPPMAFRRRRMRHGGSIGWEPTRPGNPDRLGPAFRYFGGASTNLGTHPMASAA